MTTSGSPAHPSVTSAGPERGEDRPGNEEARSAPSRARDILRSPLFQHAAALLLFAALWVPVMAPKVFGDFRHRILTSSPLEGSVFVWSLEWWTHAFSLGSNPLLTRAVWAPTGLNLAWVTTTPGPSLLMFPVTRLFGPLASFNLLTLVTPPLNAWTAYILARHVTRSFPAALVGGFLFGFSPVVLRDVQQGHLNLSMLFLLPLAGYLVVRRLDGTLRRRAFVLWFAAVLVAEFSIFTEIVATMALIGGVLGVVALLIAPPELRARVMDTARLVVVSFALTALVVAPYLYTAFAYPAAMKPGFHGLAAGAQRTSDLVRFVDPGPGFVLGQGIRPGQHPSNFWYFGIPLLLALAASWVAGWRRFAVKVLAIGFILSVVLAIGSHLPVGSARIPFPWIVLDHLPLINRARPGRLVEYASLFASLSVAMWVGRGGFRSPSSLIRWGIAILAAVAIVPKLGTNLWATNLAVPPFFGTGQYRQYLCPGDNVLVVDRANGHQVYWQVRTHLFFRTTGWYKGFRPENDPDLKLELRLAAGRIPQGSDSEVTRFVTANEVTAIVFSNALPGTPGLFASILGGAPQEVGGITLLRTASCPASG